jgi:uncharacterized protein
MAGPESLSVDEVRRIALRAQGLTEQPMVPKSAAEAPVVKGRIDPDSLGVESVHTVLRRLGAIQLDTISVLARSHELVPMARLGVVSRNDIHDAYWGTDPHVGDARAFEYWSHAACVLPVEAWPLFAARRRRYRATEPGEWHGIDPKDLTAARTKVLKLLKDGPMTASELGGAKRPGQWWSWSATKVTLEHLLSRGDLVCTRRIGWRRVYDLPERALPSAVIAADVLTDEECAIALIRESARVMGVGTVADIADVHRLRLEVVRRHLVDAGLVPVQVDGWPAAWADPEALTAPASEPSSESVTTLLSPFDSLVWFRERAARVFGMEHRLEAYTPAARRVFGYFAMPVLHNGELVARVDPGREEGTLVAKRVVFQTERGRVPVTAIEGTARALRKAAQWVGSEDVRLDEVLPLTAANRLRSALKRS